MKEHLASGLLCPHCGKPAMSLLRKSFLGPARTEACRSCGNRVSIPWWTVLLVVPLLGVFFAWRTFVMQLSIEPPPGMLISANQSAYVTGAVLMFLLHLAAHLKWVPLVKR